MKPLLVKHSVQFIYFLLFSVLFFGCEKEPMGLGNLVISDVQFTEFFYHKAIDLPSGVYQPDNPNFHPEKSETWTGNMAKYVKHFRSYTATYKIKNYGPGVAFDSEVDVIFQFSNGDEQIKTGKIGDILPNGSYNSSASINSVNNKLEHCFAEVYWFDE